jgi:hypothetical protein
VGGAEIRGSEVTVRTILGREWGPFVVDVGSRCNRATQVSPDAKMMMENMHESR